MHAARIRFIVEIVAALAFLALPFIVVPAITPVSPDPTLRTVLKGTLLIHLVIIGYYFANSYFGLPALYFSRRKRWYVLFVLLWLAAVTAVSVAEPGFNPFSHRPVPNALLLFLLTVLARFVLITFIAVAVVGYVRMKKAEEQRLRSELSYLKAQVNPHFLFNTLNNIYALTVTRSEKAPLAVTQLAAIMRYLLDKSAAETVPLREELDSIRAYVGLEKLRLTDNIEVVYSVRGEPEGKSVVPLLLLPLVENAFKHGAGTDLPARILIEAEIAASELRLTVSNSRHPATTSRGGGVGLANLRKRIAVLPGVNTLQISENETTFEARLQVALQ